MDLKLPPLTPEQSEEFFRRRARRGLLTYRFLSRVGVALILSYSVLEFMLGTPGWHFNLLLRGSGSLLLLWHIGLLRGSADEQKLDGHICRHILLMALVVCAILMRFPQGFYLGMPGLTQLLVLGGLMLVRSQRVPWLLSTVAAIYAFLWMDGQSPRVCLILASSSTAGLGLAWLASTLNEASARREFLLEQRLELEATTDPLTQVLNRRACERHGLDEVIRSTRYQHPLSLLLLDLDHFKKVNDTHGHDVGDEVLKTTARAFQSAIRSTDRVARWGGEEFLVLLPETAQREAQALGERLRQTIEGLTLLIAGEKLRITVSVGATQLRTGQSWPDLVKSADDALYQAKHQGRNRVVCG